MKIITVNRKEKCCLIDKVVDFKRTLRSDIERDNPFSDDEFFYRGAKISQMYFIKIISFFI